MDRLKVFSAVLILILGAASLSFGQMMGSSGRSTPATPGSMVSGLVATGITSSVLDSMGNLYLFESTFNKGAGRAFGAKTKVTVVPPNAGKPVAQEYDGTLTSITVGAQAVYAIRSITTTSGTAVSVAMTLVALKPALPATLPSVDLTGYVNLKVAPGASDRIYLIQGYTVMTMGASTPAAGSTLSYVDFNGSSFGAETKVTLP